MLRPQSRTKAEREAGMADKKCIKCRKGDYVEVDREVDFQNREFVLYECGKCKSLVIRKSGWDPAEWEKAGK